MRHYWGMAYFIHPLPLAAVAVLALNDRYLKFAYPSWWTGKLSDVTGLFFFPLFVCAIVCLAMNLGTGRRENIYWINRLGLLAAIVGTGLLFMLVKIWTPATWFYVRALDGLGLPSRVTYDPSDLWALLALPFTYLHGRRFIESR
jgi:hypothetical protein